MTTLDAPMPASEISLATVMRALVLHPEHVLRPYQQQSVSTQQLLQKAGLFLVMASALFALTTLVYVPPELNLSRPQVIIRFFFMLASTLIVVFPVAFAIWGILQKISSWFWNVDVTLAQMLAVSGLGLFYYALLFAVSVPLFLLKPWAPVFAELLLFVANITTFVLLIRLFKQTYQVLAGVSPKKAMGVSLFPLALMLIAYVLTQFLVFWAMSSRQMGST